MILNIIVFILFNSCSYKVKTLTTSDNKKVRVRFYKDSYRQDVYCYKKSFKRIYSKMSFEKYSGKILSDTINNFIFFQFDSVRVYIDNISLDGNKGLEYYNLIKSGLIYPKIITCALHPKCIVPQDTILKVVDKKIAIGKDSVSLSELELRYDTNFLKKNYNWTGPKIYFSYIKELPYLEKKTTRVFELEQKIFHDGPTNTYYFVEITNDKAEYKTSLSEFVKDANLTFFKYTYTTTEI